MEEEEKEEEEEKSFLELGKKKFKCFFVMTLYIVLRSLTKTRRPF